MKSKWTILPFPSALSVLSNQRPVAWLMKRLSTGALEQGRFIHLLPCLCHGLKKMAACVVPRGNAGLGGKKCKTGAEETRLLESACKLFALFSSQCPFHSWAENGKAVLKPSITISVPIPLNCFLFFFFVYRFFTMQFCFSSPLCSLEETLKASILYSSSNCICQNNYVLTTISLLEQLLNAGGSSLHSDNEMPCPESISIG